MCALLLLLAHCVRLLSAASVTILSDADTSLVEGFPNNNLGRNSNLVSGANGSGLKTRALLHFNLLGQIPPDALIQSAELILTVTTVPGGGGVDSIFTLHRLLAPWVEGVGTGNNGSPAQEGEATWADRIVSAVPWSTPGSGSPDDFIEAASSSSLVKGQGAYIFPSGRPLVADLQRWLQQPAQNFGWILISGSEPTPFTAKRFGAREDPSSSPSLRVEFLIAPRIQSLRRLADQIQFSFEASPGQTYIVEYKAGLAPGPWLTLTNFPAETLPADREVVDDIPSRDGARFYQIRSF
jgi:hypothetical protein